MALQSISAKIPLTNTTNEPTKNEGKANKKSTRTPNCFMIFSQENRPVIHAEFPRMSNAEVSRLLGERWKILHPNKKKIYREKAEALKGDQLKLPTAVVIQTSSTKRQREEQITNITTTIKKPKILEEGTLFPPVLPISTEPEETQKMENLLVDNLDFIESLIEANRALNFFMPNNQWPLEKW